MTGARSRLRGPVPDIVSTATAPALVARTGARLPHPDLPPWTLARLQGNLVEISGAGASGVLSSAISLVVEAQQGSGRYGLVAWVGTTRSLFFPPDAVDAGVELERLILIRLNRPSEQIAAATRLARSGAFGLVILDLVDSVSGIPGEEAGFRPPSSARNLRRRRQRTPPLSRLSGLARRHSSALVLLTGKPPRAPSLDPRVVQRYDARRRGNEVVITVVKDKARSRPDLPALSPGSRFERRCREPAGLC